MADLSDILNDPANQPKDQVIIVTAVKTPEGTFAAVLRIDNCADEAAAAWVADRIRPQVVAYISASLGAAFPDNHVLGYPMLSPIGRWSAICFVGSFKDKGPAITLATVLRDYAATGGHNSLFQAPNLQ